MQHKLLKHADYWVKWTRRAVYWKPFCTYRVLMERRGAKSPLLMVCSLLSYSDSRLRFCRSWKVLTRKQLILLAFSSLKQNLLFISFCFDLFSFIISARCRNTSGLHPWCPPALLLPLLTCSCSNDYICSGRDTEISKLQFSIFTDSFLVQEKDW